MYILLTDFAGDMAEGAADGRDYFCFAQNGLTPHEYAR
jgi:hypothetical protein